MWSHNTRSDAFVAMSELTRFRLKTTIFREEGEAPTVLNQLHQLLAKVAPFEQTTESFRCSIQAIGNGFTRA